VQIAINTGTIIIKLELQCLDLVINPKKSSCIRIGPRNDVTCVRICSLPGVLLPWVKEMKYLEPMHVGVRLGLRL